MNLSNNTAQREVTDTRVNGIGIAQQWEILSFVPSIEKKLAGDPEGMALIIDLQARLVWVKWSSIGWIIPQIKELTNTINDRNDVFTSKLHDIFWSNAGNNSVFEQKAKA